MLDLFNISKPQGCDIQTFYGTGGSSTTGQQAWTKPRGVSHIYMMLLGGGGNGDGVTGGGSGVVTVWYGAAQHVPDSLVVYPGLGDSNHSTVAARVSNSSSSAAALLTARSGVGANGGTAMTANQFTASGFFQSVAGQAGTTGNITPSSTTFLSGGAFGTVTANYGYTTSRNGYFQMQPIIVGTGGGGGNLRVPGGIGCGASYDSSSLGGPGMVLIASW